MATPAERIYEAAAAALGAQQETVTRITSTVAPVGVAAAAAALLIKPALVKVDQSPSSLQSHKAECGGHLGRIWGYVAERGEP